MTKNIRKSALPALAFGLAALLNCIPSTAIAREQGTTERVGYADLDLTSQAGIEALDRRLDRAVKRVCGSAAVFPLNGQAQIVQCHEDTWDSIRPQRRVAIAKATDRRDNRAFAQNATRETPVIALSK
jgi:UrcA family protein